jgi:hypothetical protein
MAVILEEVPEIQADIQVRFIDQYGPEYVG